MPTSLARLWPTLLLVVTLTPDPSYAQDSREELLRKYPGLSDSSAAKRPENPEILCPFHRMIERAGIYDAYRVASHEPTEFWVSIKMIAQIAQDFGCSILNCGGAATASSSGQLLTQSTRPGYVNLVQLHRAVGAAHDCGFTFPLGGTRVSDSTRLSTLKILESMSDSEGRLRLEDLKQLKRIRCELQGAKMTVPDAIEVDLIFTFLGGTENGTIAYSDVVRLFHAELPETLGTPGLAF